MTLVKKSIGRVPQSFGNWSASFINPKTQLAGYGKKFRASRYGCEFESLIENNTYAPATLVNGVVTPDTVHWRLVSGIPANYGLDGKLSAETARAKGVESGHETRISDLEESVGTGGSVDERIAAEGAQHYLKSETYSKEQLNNLITTPEQQYVNVIANSQTTAITDVLPATGAADTTYRVGNWDGTQYNDSVFSEYAWDGNAYIKISTKSQVGEVYDISANHADTKYADLTAALGTNGANIPQSLRKGGMSVKFVQSSDNKYVQARCMADSWSINTNDWSFCGNSVYVENPEFTEIHTDAEDKILYGVKKDGDFYFGNGVPSQIDRAKVNRVKGKSLIDEKFALSQSVVNSPEYIQVVTDSDGRIIEAITHDGEKMFSGDVTIKGQLNNANSFTKVIENQEWLKVLVDSKDHIIGGIKKNGVYDIKTVLDNTVNNLSIHSALYKECLIQQLDLMRKIIPYDIRLANSFGHLYLNPYSDITQIVHPKVLYFNNGFNGYKYWMAATPYPKMAVKLENPCIMRSNDGYKWDGIAANPLSLPDDQDGTYNSDTHLVYKNNTLECWYRYVNKEDGVSFEQIKRRTSSNGVDWNTEETMFSFSTERYNQSLSPAIIWDTDHYDIWLVNGYRGYHIEYLQSTDGHNPVKVRDINLEYNYNGVEYYVWHIDVIKDNGTFVLVAMCKEKNNSSSTAKWTLFLSTSDDNINYTTPEAIIIGSDNWDNQLYRSSIVKVGSEYRIYYSARDYSRNYFTSVSISNSLNNFIGIINL